MHRAHFQNRKTERGMSLIEALVAMLVFTVVFIAALALYSAANRAYLQTDAATIQQQNVRYAMDRVVQTVRDAGANVNPLGSNDVSDEQIEGAWESAIFVRGDFDGEIETNLDGKFPMVATGNDEIVGYVLRKPGANDEDLEVHVDLESDDGTRDQGLDYSGDEPMPTEEETRVIEVAAIELEDQTDPPYQLTRVTFDEDGDVKYEVIAENIFRMSFQYLDANGNPVVSEDDANLGGEDEERIDRAAIRRIAIDIIGMADRKDLNYTDPNTYEPAEDADTKAYRKFRLRERVWPVNLGLEGKVHNPVPTLDLDAPDWIRTCAGHCNNFFLEWDTSDEAGITTYRVKVTPTTPPGLDIFIDVPGTHVNFESDGVTTVYAFAVAPLSNIGIEGEYSPTVTHTVSHADTVSIPSAPSAAPTVTQTAGENSLALTWPVVATNTGTITTSTCRRSDGSTSAPGSGSTEGASWATAAVDLGPYRVYRSTTNTFDAATTPQVQTETIVDLVNTATDETEFTDNTAAVCQSYYYWIMAEDLCNKTGAQSPISASSAIIPAAGVVPDAPGVPTATTLTSNGTNYNVVLKWPHVTRTEDGAKGRVSHYTITRKRKRPTLGETTYQTDPLYTTITVNALTSAEPTMTTADTPLVKTNGADTHYEYTVYAVYQCGAFSGNTDRISDASPPFELICVLPTTETVTITNPPNGSTITRPMEGIVPMEITVGGNLTSWNAATMQVFAEGATTPLYEQNLTGAPAAGKYVFPSWDAGGVDPGVYTIRGSATQGTCTKWATEVTVEVEDATCGLQIVTVTPAYTGSGANTNKTLNFKIQNTCTDQAIAVNGLKLTWVGGPNFALARLNAIRHSNSFMLNGATLSTGADANFSTGNTFTIAAGQTSGLIEVTFSHAMKSTGTPVLSTSYSSIIAKTTTGGADEILLTTPYTP